MSEHLTPADEHDRTDAADDIWAAAGRSEPEHPQDGDFAAASDEHPAPGDVVDAAAVEVPPKDKKLGPKLALAGIAAVAVLAAGGAMYSMIDKLFPSSRAQATRSLDAAPVVAEVEHQPIQDTLAGQKAAPAAVTIGAAPAPAASQPAGALIIGAAAAPDVAPPASAVAAPAPATVPAAAVAAPSESAKAPADAAPIAVEKAQAASTKAADDAPTAAPVRTVSLEEASREARRQARAEQRARAKAKAAEAAAARRARQDEQARAGESAAPSTASKVARSKPMKVGKASASRVASGQRSKRPTARATRGGEVEKAISGTLSAYRIELISPQHGEHQMAWVRRGSKLRVVSAGDTIDGMRVIKVDAARFLVQTNQGEIR